MNGAEDATDLKTPVYTPEPSERADESSFATFENPRIESVNFHVVRHWEDLRIARIGERAADTQDVLVSCNRCEVRYLLEDLPSERIPGTEAFENLSA